MLLKLKMKIKKIKKKMKLINKTKQLDNLSKLFHLIRILIKKKAQKYLRK